MPNIAKIANLAPIFDSNRRPVEEATFEELQNVNVGFDAYQIREGETLKFPALKDMDYRKQPTRAGGDNLGYLVACERTDKNGNTKPSWFSLSFFMKRDIDQKYIFPEWKELGSAQKQVEKLAELGELKAGKVRTINVPDFNRDGTAKYEVVKDENGQPKLNDDGEPITTRASKPQDVVELPLPPGVKAAKAA